MTLEETMSQSATHNGTHSRTTQQRGTNQMNWKDTPTRTIDVNGVPFAYREFGTDSGVPVVSCTT